MSPHPDLLLSAADPFPGREKFTSRPLNPTTPASGLPNPRLSLPTAPGQPRLTCSHTSQTPHPSLFTWPVPASLCPVFPPTLQACVEMEFHAITTNRKLQKAQDGSNPEAGCIQEYLNSPQQTTCLLPPSGARCMIRIGALKKAGFQSLDLGLTDSPCLGSRLQKAIR